MKFGPLLFLLLSTYAVNAQFEPRTIIDNDAAGITEICAADLDGDDLNEIIVSQKFGFNNYIAFYTNMGNGQFSAATIAATNVNWANSVTAGDLNGDGWNDLVYVAQLGHSLAWSPNSGGSFGPKVLIDTNLLYATDVKIADMDNDLDPDLVAIGDTTLAVYFNDGNGNFLKQTVPHGLSTEFYDLTIADLDGDGLLDIVVGGIKTIIYMNTGGQFAYDAARTNSFGLTGLILVVQAADVDGDGDMDLVQDGSVGEALRWFSNDGNGSFNAEQDLETVLSCRSIAIGDMDNDGDMDVLTAFDQSGEVVWYQNDGTGVFGPKTLVHLGNIPFTLEVLLADLNGDNLKDAIWSEELSVHINSTTVGIPALEVAQLDASFSNGALNINVLFEGDLTVFDELGRIVYSPGAVQPGQHSFPIKLDARLYIIELRSVERTARVKLFGR